MSTVWKKIFGLDNYDNQLFGCKEHNFSLWRWFWLVTCVSNMSHSAEVSLNNKSLRDVSRTKVEKGMKSFDTFGSINLPQTSLDIQSSTMEAIPGLCETGWFSILWVTMQVCSVNSCVYFWDSLISRFCSLFVSATWLTKSSYFTPKLGTLARWCVGEDGCGCCATIGISFQLSSSSCSFWYACIILAILICWTFLYW